MSRHGDISLPFGPEERIFRLGIEQWRHVQEKCDAGPPELLGRLEPIVRAIQAKLTFNQILSAHMMGTWRVDDIREVLLQGLIGGGMGATEAGILIRAQFDDKLSWEHAPIAYLVIEASLRPPEDEPLPVGEKPAAKRKPSRRSQGAKSDLRTASASAQ